jgi:carbamoyl-phosphate synthase large subunit
MGKNRINVAISGVGGDVGMGTIKALEESGLPIEFFLMSIDPKSAWLYRYPNRAISPPVNSAHYLDFLLSYIGENKIEVFIPTIDSEIVLVAKHRKNLEKETGCKIFVNSFESAEITQDKYLTYKFLKSNNFSTPETFIYNEEFQTSEILFPCILKPRKGAGSKNISLVNSSKDLEFFERDSNFVIQEYLSSTFPEFTCGVYLNNSGEVMGASLLKRELLNGSTHFAERVINPVIEAEVIKVAQILNTKYLNVQAKFDGENLQIFELNGRLSGTTSIVAKIFNAPSLFIREEVCKEDISRSESIDEFIAIKYQDEVYIPKQDYLKMMDETSNI